MGKTKWAVGRAHIERSMALHTVSNETREQRAVALGGVSGDTVSVVPAFSTTLTRAFASGSPGEEHGEPVAEPISWKLSRALVVGAHIDTVNDNLRSKLRSFGIDVVDHWPYKGGNGGKNIPANADVVIVLTDATEHADSDRALAKARKLTIPVINGDSHWSVLEARLRAKGYAPVPQAVTDTAFGPVTARGRTVRRPAEPVPPAADAQPAPAPAPPTAPTVDAPPPVAVSGRGKPKHEGAPIPPALRARLFEQAVCEDPSRDTRALADRVLALARENGIANPRDRQFDTIVAEARAKCGIRRQALGAHGARVAVFAPDLYRVACARYGVTPDQGLLPPVPQVAVNVSSADVAPPVPVAEIPALAVVEPPAPTPPPPPPPPPPARPAPAGLPRAPRAPPPPAPHPRPDPHPHPRVRAGVGLADAGRRGPPARRARLASPPARLRARQRLRRQARRRHRHGRGVGRASRRRAREVHAVTP